MNHSENVRLAVALAGENKRRYVVLAQRWPGVGWTYYYAMADSLPARKLRAWRRSWEASQHG